MDRDQPTSSSRINNSTGLAGLFSVPRTLDSPRSSSYSTSSRWSPGSTTPPSSRRNYESSYSSRDYQTSRDYPSSAYSSAYTGRYAATYQSRSRPFTSRFLKSSHNQDSPNNNNNIEEESNKRDESSNVQNNSNQTANDDKSQEPKKSRKKSYLSSPTVLNNGRSVIRMRREMSTSEEEESSSEEEPEIVPEVEPEPEPEDPLDREEQDLNNQLMLALTLTLVDEENIRQRLLEIRKAKLRKNQESVEQNLVAKFVSDADVTLFENQQSPAKQEEERILTLRLDNSSELSEVDQKDIQVRLQELFRDRKNVLESCLRNIEGTYEHILQETSTELNELESSIRNKTELVEKLQEEMLSMIVRKELLAKAMETINSSHQQKTEGISEAMAVIDTKMSQYAVLLPPQSDAASQNTKNPKLSDIEPSDELREIELELECPVCMEIARPPIYQCEEGHIICAHCKPLLTNCPHNCGKKYSEPAIRCRFAEKLADKYAAQLGKHFGTSGKKPTNNTFTRGS